MGTAPVLSLLVSMSLPAMFSMLIQSLYNIVDSIFVAKLGENALTAVSLAFPIQTLLIAVGVGTGVGLNSVISRRLGAKDQAGADSAASHGLLLGLFSGIVFAVLGFLFTETFFTSFTSDPQVLQMGCDYVYIVTIFSFGSLIQICMEKTLQATGNMFYPMIFQLVGAITNIILDPIFIFGLLGMPALGVKGAAIATVAGQILAMLFSLYVVFTKSHVVTISLKGFRFNGAILRDIYIVGIPSMVMQSISSVLTTLLNGILIGFSGAAVSVLGVYYKLQSFVFMPVFGLTHGLMPILGYNYGANNKKRLTDALKYGHYIGAGIMAVGMLLFMVFPRQLLMLFSASDEMMRIGVPALRIMSTCFIFASVGIIFSTLFQALGNGVYSLFVSVLRQLVIILPAAYFLAKFFGLELVWLAFPMAEGVACCCSFLLFFKIYRDKISPMDKKESL